MRGKFGVTGVHGTLQRLPHILLASWAGQAEHSSASLRTLRGHFGWGRRNAPAPLNTVVSNAIQQEGK